VKASELKGGMVLNGWNVTGARAAGVWVGPGTDEWDAVVLLTLDRWVDQRQVGATLYPGYDELRRTWYRADEEVNP
jgi:hypothetical protein